MKTLRVKGKSNCGLIISPEGNEVVIYLKDNTIKYDVNDSVTFEEFATEDEARTRALIIQPNCRIASLFGDTEETNDDIS